MERFLFFHTHTAQVIYHREFSSQTDNQKLAFECYCLLQNSNFTLKALEYEELYCFNYRKELACAVVCVFPKDTDYTEATSVTEQMLCIFLEHLGHLIGKKILKSQLRPARASLCAFFTKHIECKLEALNSLCSLNFFFALLVGAMPQPDSARQSGEAPILLSFASSINSNFSASERIKYSARTFKKKLPLVKVSCVSALGKVLLKFGPAAQELETELESLGGLITQATQLGDAQSGSAFTLTLPLKGFASQIVKKEELVMVYSSQQPMKPSDMQALLAWTKLIVSS